jgi:hypothetical protein
MRHLLLSAIVLVAMTGCGVELLATTAITSELNAQSAQSSARALQYAKETVGNISLEQAIQTYQAETGNYPATLQALVPSHIAAVPTQPNGQPYGYDPTTGRLLTGAAAAAPKGPTTADRQRANQVANAIFQYGQATGYYPNTLYDLVPYYLAAYPRTDGGQDFLYNNQTGELFHPAQFARNQGQPNQRRGAGGAGAGPLGEVMTGVAMQNDLNNMSNAGSSAAGGYGRSNVGNVQADHTARQNQVMDDLGL